MQHDFCYRASHQHEITRKPNLPRDRNGKSRVSNKDSRTADSDQREGHERQFGFFVSEPVSNAKTIWLSDPSNSFHDYLQRGLVMTRWESLAFLTAVAVVFVVATAVAAEQDTLEKLVKKLNLNLSKGEISVSGISPGGFMAHQFHVAHSADLKGAGIIAGGPYYCAQGSLDTAIAECTTIGEQSRWGPDWPYRSYRGPCPAPVGQQARCNENKAVAMAEQAISDTLKFSKKNKIDDPIGLADDKVILILGKSDRLVPQGVMDAMGLYYEMIYKKYNKDPENFLSYPKRLPAEHSVPIDNFIGLKVATGNEVDEKKNEQVGNCTTFGSPYLNVCTKQDCKEICCTKSDCSAYNNLVSTCGYECDPQCSMQCAASVDAVADAALAILKHIYDDGKSPWNIRNDKVKIKDWDWDLGKPVVDSNCQRYDNKVDKRCQWLRKTIFVFDQPQKLPGGHFTYLADKGFIFIPEKCTKDAKSCKRLHIAFHGCEQGYDFPSEIKAIYSKLWTPFVENAGFNEWADANDIVVLYPQAQPVSIPFQTNPKGCWDFWGYGGINNDYHTKEGRQISAVWQMVERLVPDLLKKSVMPSDF